MILTDLNRKRNTRSEDSEYGSGRTHTTSQGQGPPQSSPTSLKGAPRSNQTLTLGILQLLQHRDHSDALISHPTSSTLLRATRTLKEPSISHKSNKEVGLTLDLRRNAQALSSHRIKPRNLSRTEKPRWKQDIEADDRRTKPES